MITRRIVLSLSAAAVAAGLALGTAFAQSGGGSATQTWTTVFKSSISIEGLTLDDDGNLYVPQRAASAGADCSIVRISSTGGANQEGVVVAKMNDPCNPAGLAFGPDGRLYLTGFGLENTTNTNNIGVVRPRATGPTPEAELFATGTLGGNGLAFDEDGNLYVSDGVTNLGRVFRLGPAGGAATVLFRVPPMTNSGGGRTEEPVAPANTGRCPAGDRRQRPRVRPRRHALRRGYGSRRALARRVQPERRGPHVDGLRHHVPDRHALPGGALRPAPGTRRRRRHRARPQPQRVGGRERAERDRRGRPPGRRDGVLPQPGRRRQPAERRAARGPDEPRARRAEALHDELGPQPAGQLPELGRRSCDGDRSGREGVLSRPAARFRRSATAGRRRRRRRLTAEGAPVRPARPSQGSSTPAAPKLSRTIDPGAYP